MPTNGPGTLPRARRLRTKASPRGNRPKVASSTALGASSKQARRASRHLARRDPTERRGLGRAVYPGGLGVFAGSAPDAAGPLIFVTCLPAATLDVRPCVHTPREQMGPPKRSVQSRRDGMLAPAWYADNRFGAVSRLSTLPVVPRGPWKIRR